MIITNGKVRRTVPEQVSENMVEIQKLKDANFVRQDDVVDNLSSYQTKKPLSANQGRILKDMLNQAIAGVFHYKGSVATFNDLPSSGMEIGDTYNALDTGNNFTWDGTGWDQLSGLVDLSAYYTKAESDAKYVDLTTNQDISGIKTIIYDLRFVDSTGQSTTVNSIKTNQYGGLQFLRDNGVTFTIGGSDVKFNNKHMLPANNNTTYSIGSATASWNNLYLNGAIDFGNNAKIQKDTSNRINILYNDNVRAKFGNTEAHFVCHLEPDSANSYDLGRTGLRWRTTYTDNISDGTQTVSTTDIINLITYAKGQGWIQ